MSPALLGAVLAGLAGPRVLQGAVDSSSSQGELQVRWERGTGGDGGILIALPPGQVQVRLDEATWAADARPLRVEDPASCERRRAAFADAVSEIEAVATIPGVIARCRAATTTDDEPFRWEVFPAVPGRRGLLGVRVHPAVDRLVFSVASGDDFPLPHFPWWSWWATSLDVSVDADGLYRLSGTELRQGGAAYARVEDLALATGDEPVAFHPVDLDGDGVLEAEDGIEFYGRAGSTRYSRSRIYRVRRDAAGTGARMAVEPPPDPAVSPGAASLDTTFAVGEWSLYSLVVQNGERDNYFWRLLSRTSSFTTTIALPGVDSLLPSTLAVELQGTTSFPDVNPDHHVRVTLNGQVVGDILFDGKSEKRVELSVPPGTWTGGSETLLFSVVNDNAAAFDYAFLDSIEVRYARTPTWLPGETQLPLEVEAGVPFELGPFPGADPVVVLDVSDPLQPKTQRLQPQPDGNGGYRAVGLFPGAPGARLPIRVSALPRTVAAVQGTRGADLLSDTAGADLVVVTSKELLAAAGRLAAHREEEGLRVAVVRVDDVFGAFSAGESNPWAIRDFLAFALANWDVPPRWVLLLGDGSYDFRGDQPNAFLPANVRHVPPVLLDGEFGEYASDNALVDFDGDHLPELAVGRLPAADAAEAEEMVDKILAYETLAYGVGFEERALLVADDWTQPWEQQYFEGLTLELASELPPWVEAETLLMSELGGAATAARILDSLNDGVAWVNYFGHGSYNSWAAEQVFALASLASVENEDAPFFATSLTCSNATFHFPNVGPTGSSSRGLAESAVLRPEGGAVGFWASTANVYAEPLPPIALEFVRTAFQGRNWRVGDAILAAKRASDPEVQGNSDALESFTLLGDPSMVLRVNHLPVAVPVLDGTTDTGAWLPLDGAGSWDPDAQSLRYRWSIDSGPSGSEAIIATPDADRTRFWADLAGTYVLSLEVSDGLAWSDPVLTTVVAAGPSVAPPREERRGTCQVGSAGSAPDAGWTLAVLGVLLLARRRATG